MIVKNFRVNKSLYSTKYVNKMQAYYYMTFTKINITINTQFKTNQANFNINKTYRFV